MKLKITTMIAASLLFTGCASTTPVAPTLEYSNDEPYVWDDSKSLALNITKSALDVSSSLRDTEMPEGASITKSAGWKNTASVVDFLSGGIGGLLVGEAFRSNSGKEWRPTYIWLEPKSDKVKTYKEVADTFKGKFKAMLEGNDKIEFVDFYTRLKKPNEWGSSFAVVSGEWCANTTDGFAQEYDLTNVTHIKDIERGQLSFTGKGCVIHLQFNPVETLIRDGKEHSVYSMSLGNFYKYGTLMSQGFDGYFAVPARAKEVGTGPISGYDYPFVINNGAIHLFTNPEQVISLDEWSW